MAADETLAAVGGTPLPMAGKLRQAGRGRVRRTVMRVAQAAVGLAGYD